MATFNVPRFGGEGGGGGTRRSGNNGGVTPSPPPTTAPTSGQMTPEMAHAMVQSLFANPGPQASFPAGLFGGLVPPGAPPLTGFNAAMQQARMPQQFQTPQVMPGATAPTWRPM